MKFRNVNTGLELTEKEYNEMIDRETKDAWEKMDEDEKIDWESFEKYSEYIKGEPDGDFEVVE